MRKMRTCVMVLILLAGLSLKAHETGFPEQTLKKVFPEATGFTLRKKTLTADQVKKVEQLSGSKVQHNDNPLSVYVALGKAADGSGALGSVLMVDAQPVKGSIDLAVGIKRDGTIHRVVVVENKGYPGTSSPEFLDQFKGKSAQSPLVLGKDIHYSGDKTKDSGAQQLAAQAVLDAVRRSLRLMEAAGTK